MSKLTAVERRKLINEEFPLLPEALAEKHGGVWGNHPLFGKEDWQLEVANNDTVQGYWDWVEGQIEQAWEGDEDDACSVCHELLEEGNGDNWGDLCPACADKVSEYMDQMVVSEDTAIDFMIENPDWEPEDANASNS